MKEVFSVIFIIFIILMIGMKVAISLQEVECRKRGYSKATKCGCYNQIGDNYDYEIDFCENK